MPFDMGEKIKIKTLEGGSPSRKGTFIREAIVVAFDSASDYLLIFDGTDWASGLYQLEERDITKWQNRPTDYKLYSNISDYIGKGSCWTSGKSIESHLAEGQNNRISGKAYASNGMHCCNKSCNAYNAYATPNMPNGTYQCFNCRNNGFHFQDPL